MLAGGMIPWRQGGYECITREQSDLTNPDRATAQTIGRMAQLTSESISTPRLDNFARKAALSWRGGPLYGGRPINWDDEKQLTCSVWCGVNSHLKFQEHSEQIRALLNERDQLQLLISPDLLLSKRRPSGDCAVYTPLVCAALGTLGIHYEFVTLACDPRDPNLYTHVYARAVLRDGSRIPVDASHGQYCGWEVPRAHQIRKQVWHASGRPIDDKAPSPVAHLGQYRRVRRVMPRRIAAGLGQVDDTSTTTLSYPGIPVDMSQVPYQIPDITATTSPTIPPPATVPFNWDAAIGNFLNQGIRLAGQVVAPQVTLVRGPGGQLYYQAPASSGTTIPAAGVLTPGTTGNWILIGGVVVIGILALSAMSKR